ncbi:MAG: ParA family protein [Rhodobacter sp.]|nr:ParA family protein [Rhodobacter sp.]
MSEISIISQKGGVGKTTLATALAVEADRDGRQALLLDLDPQASASFWNDSRLEGSGPAVTAIPPARLEHYLNASKEAGADFVFIDTPPFAKDIAYDAAKLADLVLVPAKPAVLDITAMTRTVDLIKAFSRRAAVVLTFCPPVGGEIEEAREAVGQLGIELCPVRIGNRIAFSRAQQSGRAAQEHEPQGKAAAEVRHLYEYTCIHAGVN